MGEYREDRGQLFSDMHSERTQSGQKLAQVIFQLDMRGGKEKKKKPKTKLDKLERLWNHCSWRFS